MQNFNELGLPQPLFHRLEQIGFKTPTPVQAQSIPHALEGRDILGTAQTGTGKTAAYGIPLVTKLLTTDRGTALVLLPTRELAIQVMAALKQFIGSSKIKTAMIIGGEPMPKQLNQLRQNPRLIVGTPGRINDHLDRGTLMLHNTNFLVLDEVDRMLDMGFGVQLDAMARFLTAKRQTLMFSATLPDNITKVSKKYLTDPIRVTVGETHKPAENVEQVNIKLSEQSKYTQLLEELNARMGSIIVFVKTKHGADRMAGKLRKDGHKADALHGDLRQNKRNRVISDYRDQKFRILIGTDVAARGLDIPHIEHVINYDLPQVPEDYIHRIGRTARAGAEGHAVNFLTPADRIKWTAILKLLNPGEKVNADADLGPREKHNPSQKRGGGNRSRNGGGKPRSGGGNRSRNGDDKPRGGGKGKPAFKGKSGGGNGGGNSQKRHRPKPRSTAAKD